MTDRESVARERVEGKVSGREHITGRVQRITVTVEPTHDQLRRLNKALESGDLRASLIIHQTTEEEGEGG